MSAQADRGRDLVRLGDLQIEVREGLIRALEPACTLCEETPGEVMVQVPAKAVQLYAHLAGAASPDAFIVQFEPCVCGAARQAARRINGARLPHFGFVASFENTVDRVAVHDVTLVPAIAAQLGVAVQTAQRFVAALQGPNPPQGMAIAGGAFAGKTHLLAAVGLAAALAGRKCRFMPWATLRGLWETPLAFDFDPRSDDRLLLVDDVELQDEGSEQAWFVELINARLRLGAATVVVFKDMDLTPLPHTGPRSVAAYLTGYQYSGLTSGGAVELGEGLLGGG